MQDVHFSDDLKDFPIENVPKSWKRMEYDEDDIINNIVDKLLDLVIKRENPEEGNDSIAENLAQFANTLHDIVNGPSEQSQSDSKLTDANIVRKDANRSDSEEEKDEEDEDLADLDSDELRDIEREKKRREMVDSNTSEEKVPEGTEDIDFSQSEDIDFGQYHLLQTSPPNEPKTPPPEPKRRRSPWAPEPGDIDWPVSPIRYHQPGTSEDRRSKSSTPKKPTTPRFEEVVPEAVLASPILREAQLTSPIQRFERSTFMTRQMINPRTPLLRRGPLFPHAAVLSSRPSTPIDVNQSRRSTAPSTPTPDAHLLKAKLRDMTAEQMKENRERVKEHSARFVKPIKQVAQPVFPPSPTDLF